MHISSLSMGTFSRYSSGESGRMPPLDSGRKACASQYSNSGIIGERIWVAMSSSSVSINTFAKATRGPSAGDTAVAEEETGTRSVQAFLLLMSAMGLTASDFRFAPMAAGSTLQKDLEPPVLAVHRS